MTECRYCHEEIDNHDYVTYAGLCPDCFRRLVNDKKKIGKRDK
jgi:hypothetical protein